MTFQVVPNHIYGPAVVSDDGWLVDNGPLDSIERICAALNECMTADLGWALPAVAALQPHEVPRLIRALAKLARLRTS